jgi:hypothetical protein
VTFYKIRHGWSTNSQLGPTDCILLTWHEYIMLVPHVRYAPKKFFYYRNIILCQLGGPHCQLTLGLNIFSNETQNAQDRVEPMTPWSLHDYTTNLLLHLCCRVTYYFFVLCSVYSFCLVSTVVKFKLKFKFKSKLKFKFKFNFLQIYSKFCLNWNSSSSLNSNLSEFNLNSNLERGA